MSSTTDSAEKSIKLVPLKCPDCGMLLDPKGERFASCNACGITYQVTRSGLLPVKIRTAKVEGKTLRPFWVFKVNVKITHRDATGSVGSFFGKLTGSDQSAAGDLRVFVPAFKTSSSDLMKLALRLTERQPKYATTDIGEVRDVVLTEDEAKKFIVPVVMGVEVRRKDTLHSISFDVKIQGATLDWVWV